MPLYDFKSTFNAIPITTSPLPTVENTPSISQYPQAVNQLSDAQQGRSKIFGEALGTQPDHIEEFITPGFRALDESMKAYWSGIRIPTKDAYRLLAVKIAGGDKSILMWKSDIDNGRVMLPVASISRLKHEFYKEKYSPPFHAMCKRYISTRADRVALVRRPVPYLVDYEISIWSESKRDAENVAYQMMTRFNPLAEFVMNDGHIFGSVQLRSNGLTDASDKEIAYDQKAKVRYEISMTAEAWLPLPEKIVPTILGNVNIFKESVGNILLNQAADTLLAQRGTSAPAYEPSE